MVLSEKQFVLFTEGCGLVVHGDLLYECIGFQDGKYILSEILFGDTLFVSEKALRHSTEFYYSERW